MAKQKPAASRDAKSHVQIGAHTAYSTVEIDCANMKVAKNVPRAQRVFVSRTGEEGDARFLVAIKVQETNSSAQLMVGGRDARQKAATSLRWVDPVSALRMVAAAGVPSRVVINRLSPLQNFVSSMAGVRSAHMKDARRLLGVERNIAQRYVYSLVFVFNIIERLKESA